MAQGNIAPYLFFGQALAWAQSRVFDWRLAVLAQLFGVFDHLYIVFANDLADEATDARNRTFNLFSGGSRALSLGAVRRPALARAAQIMGAGTLAVSAVLAWATAQGAFIVIGALAITLLWAYSFPPIRLSYRGGGEWLQGAGIGIVLPLAGYLAQRGPLASLPWRCFAPTFLLGMAGNVITSLPDTPSDRESQKRSLPVRVGEPRARAIAMGLVAVALLLFFFVSPPVSPVARAAIVGIPFLMFALALVQSPSANATNPKACFRFVALAAGAGTVFVLGWTVALLLPS